MITDAELRHALTELADNRPDTEEIARSVRSRLLRRRGGIRLLTTSAAAVVVAATVILIALAFRPVRFDPAAPPEITSSSARCYATADLTPEHNFLSVTLVDKAGEVPIAASALSLCREMWISGRFSTRPPYVNNEFVPADARPDPKLVRCVLPAERSDDNEPEIAVVPGVPGTCEKLGLASYD
ncbi:hypothetical protein GIS00_02410 [Nakamurella sp. YIM 132087]|uniref:Uncharacterized protein n=1 Tax=Nakamurella alba TaxID=2665158 RepID=A0A7K1FFB8_9ACTN|nr:hypothetical protein [Nakamurella alba]MTD12797.1 hypothetical protein [Nakamurella alba]